MAEVKKKGLRLNLGLTKEVIAVIISVISFLISSITVYTSSLKAPDISFITAPYIKHVVDNQSLNEAFFIPLTVINRGARPGTLLAVELSVTHVPSGAERTYFGQYFTQDNSQTNIGDFFTPITLNGHSSAAYTLCFYPLGQRAENFFSQPGLYQFEVVSKIANVRDEFSQTAIDTFQVTVDEAMQTVMQSQSDGEYAFPIAVENER